MPAERGGLPDKDITKYRSVLIGLMGHVDCGKTSVARMLSEIISTAGLDAHPQSKQRGITIDIGFTSFLDGNTIITLVDAPGHADLIRNVVAAANIIKGAILVVDAVEGIQIQTAEHIVILESMGIHHIVVALNKIDIAEPTQIKKTEQLLRKVFKKSVFGENVPIVKISAVKNIGGDALRDAVRNMVNEILDGLKDVSNDNKTPLIIPIDHHFPVKGRGVVVTGTTLSGAVRVGSVLTVFPNMLKVKVKSLQVYRTDTEWVPEGFRVGALITDISPDMLARGDILTDNPEIFKKTDLLDVTITHNGYFRHPIGFGSQISVSIGLGTVPARIYPYTENNGLKIIESEGIPLPSRTGEKMQFRALLKLLRPIYAVGNEKLLLSRLDLPPTELRFFGTAEIISIYEIGKEVPLYRYKIKTGRIRNAEYSENKILVEGLAMGRKGAERLVGFELDNPPGKIIAPFGNRGVVIVEISSSERLLYRNGREVLLKIPRRVKY